MGLNWINNDYFSLLLHRDKRSSAALEMLVDDLHAEKDRTITRFLCHSGSEDFLWGLVHLLASPNTRVAGNSAYIIGTLAESEVGSMRVIQMTGCGTPDSRRILPDLTRMLTFEDSESVMNAAGTMGTLAETHDGRQWMMSESCLDQTITCITNLLSNDNLWTASNAALVLARLTIAEEGCCHLLNHSLSEHILTCLIQSLGVDEAGRGMNSAFAIGRLCDMESGRLRLLGLPDSEKMISQLARMLCCTDAGASKNACFALSCLATNREGHHRLLKNAHADDVIKMLAELLASEDSETGWFAAMTLRTLASQPKGCTRLREHSSILPALQSAAVTTEVNPDLREEVILTIDILKRLEKCSNLEAKVLNAESVEISWCSLSTKSGLPIRYQVYEGAQCVYHGRDTVCKVGQLVPNHEYQFGVRGLTEGDEGPFSDFVSVTTEESVPSCVENLKVIGCTTTQLKVGWEPPVALNGILKGYYIYNNKNLVEHTQELSSIMSGLQPNSNYEIAVCAATYKGKGPKSVVNGTTSEMGAHAPSKPEVNVRGRSEMQVLWRPPEVPLGRISRYDVYLNGDVVYSGTDLHYVARGLRPFTEYTFTVTAITSEGRCESKPTKKRTGKDEWDGENRAPLYQTPKKDMVDEEPTVPSILKSSKKRKPNSEKLSSPVPEGSVSLPTRSSREAPRSAVNIKNQIAEKKVHHLAPLKFAYTHVEQGRDPCDRASPSSAPGSGTDSGKHKRHSLGNIYENGGLGTKTELGLELSASRDSLAKLRKDKPTLKETKDADIKLLTTSLDSMLPKSERSKHLPKPVPRQLKTSKLGTLSDLNESSSESPVESESSQRQSKHNLSDSASVRSTASVTRFSKGDILTMDIDRHGNIVRPKSGTASPHKHRKSKHSKKHISPEPKATESYRNSVMNNCLINSSPVIDTTEEIAEETRLLDDSNSWNSKRVEMIATQEVFTKIVSSGVDVNQRVPLPHALKSGVLDFEVPVSNSANNRTNYYQRANTFMASHRPQTKRHLEKLSAAKLQSHPPSAAGFGSNVGPPQWQPDLPKSDAVKNTNKFVPMQFRTQPANLPNNLLRQNTQIQLQPEKAPLGPIEPLSRSRTEIGVRFTPNQDANGFLANSSLSSQRRASRQRSTSFKESNSSSASSYDSSGKKIQRGSASCPNIVSSSPPTTEQLLPGLGVTTESAGSQLSAR